MGMPLSASAGLFAPEQDGGALPAPRSFIYPPLGSQELFVGALGPLNVPKMTKGEKDE
jgi:hypothetical protein